MTRKKTIFDFAEFSPIRTSALKLQLLIKRKKGLRKTTGNVTFMCVIVGILTNMDIEELKGYLKDKMFPITNATRIKISNGPLPLVRLSTKEPALSSDLITNSFIRYKVEGLKQLGDQCYAELAYSMHLHATILKFIINVDKITSATPVKNPA